MMKTVASLLVFLVSLNCIPSARAVSTPECVNAFNRVGTLANQGDAMCRIQAQVMAAIDTAARACAGQDLGGADFGALKSQFISEARQCPDAGSSSQDNGSASNPLSHSAEDKAVTQARTERERANAFMAALHQCETLDSGDAVRCKLTATQNYSRAGGGGSGDGAAGLNQGNSSANGASGDEPDPPTPPKPASQPKDPNADYDGQSCSFFTRPALEEGRMNYYAPGACAAYGGIAYKCQDTLPNKGRWKKLGPNSVFFCKTAQEVEGESSP